MYNNSVGTTQIKAYGDYIRLNLLSNFQRSRNLIKIRSSIEV